MKFNSVLNDPKELIWKIQNKTKQKTTNQLLQYHIFIKYDGLIVCKEMSDVKFKLLVFHTIFETISLYAKKLALNHLKMKLSTNYSLKYLIYAKNSIRTNLFAIRTYGPNLMEKKRHKDQLEYIYI